MVFSFIHWSLLNKDVRFVQMLNIPLNLGQLFLICLFPPLHPNGIEYLNMSHLLILMINFLPFSLQPLSQFIHLLFCQTFSTFLLKCTFLHCSLNSIFGSFCTHCWYATLFFINIMAPDQSLASLSNQLVLEFFWLWIRCFILRLRR